MASVPFKITVLQNTLVAAASGIVAGFYANPIAGLGPSQLTNYITTATLAASGTTDTAGSVTVTLTESTPHLINVAGFAPTYFTTPAATNANAYVLVNPITSLTKVHGIIQGADGTPQAGVTITANLNASGPVIATNLLLAQTATTTSDANGAWSLSLTANDLITTPHNTLYTFVFSLPSAAPQLAPFYAYGIPVKPHGPSVSRVVEVPNVAVVDFSTLV